MSGIGEVAQALADPTRRRVVTVLACAPARTGQLAAATDTTASALSRHLTVLRAAGIVERGDVADDGRGREYRLREGALDEFGDWITASRWAAQLAGSSSEPATQRSLRRLGSFLDAFAAADHGFFERHLSDDVQLVFPDTPAPMGRSDALDAVGSHPAWRRYDVEPGASTRRLGTHTLLSAVATIEHEHDPRPRRVFIAALFAETRPWRLAHLQWTTATEPNGADDDGA